MEYKPGTKATSPDILISSASKGEISHDIASIPLVTGADAAATCYSVEVHHKEPTESLGAIVLTANGGDGVG